MQKQKITRRDSSVVEDSDAAAEVEAAEGAAAASPAPVPVKSAHPGSSSSQQKFSHAVQADREAEGFIGKKRDDRITEQGRRGRESEGTQ